MKPILLLSLCSALLLAGCKKSSETKEKTASFKVQLIQKGNYDNYTRQFYLGPKMVYQESGKSAWILHSEDLADSTYNFISPEPLSQLELSLDYGWLENDNTAAQVSFKVFRNNVQIDSQAVNLQPVNAGTVVSREWTYKP